MSKTTGNKKHKRTPEEQTAYRQRIAQAKARAKCWAEQRKTRIKLASTSTTQQLIVSAQDLQRPRASEEHILITVTTPGTPKRSIASGYRKLIRKTIQS